MVSVLRSWVETWPSHCVVFWAKTPSVPLVSKVEIVTSELHRLADTFVIAHHLFFG